MWVALPAVLSSQVCAGPWSGCARADPVPGLASLVTMEELNNNRTPPMFPFPTIRRLYLPSGSPTPINTRSLSAKSQIVPSPSSASHESEGYLALLSRVSRLETKIAELRREKAKLTVESEQRMQVLQNVLADRASLRSENDRIKKDAWAWRNKYEMLSSRVRQGIIWLVPLDRTDGVELGC